MMGLKAQGNPDLVKDRIAGWQGFPYWYCRIRQRQQSCYCWKLQTSHWQENLHACSTEVYILMIAFSGKRCQPALSVQWLCEKPLPDEAATIPYGQPMCIWDASSCYWRRFSVAAVTIYGQHRRGIDVSSVDHRIQFAEIIPFSKWR